MPAVIDSFRGPYAFLSNFAPVGATTVEHQWQAEKSLDAAVREQILAAPTPGEAKRLARRCALRPDWEEIKRERMRHWLRWTFAQEPFASALEATGEAVLIEGNAHGDRVWGCTWEGGRWVGKNWLGQLLMEVRAERRAAKAALGEGGLTGTLAQNPGPG